MNKEVSGHVLDKGRGNDDAGTKVAGEEVDIDVDAQASHAGRDDGKERGGGGYNEDHKEGGDAGTQATVVLIPAGIDVADNGGRVSRVEVDAGGVEPSRHGEVMRDGFLSRLRGGLL